MAPNESGPKTQIKKVKAYPIAAKLQVGTDPLSAKIVKLTAQGFLAEILTASFKVGDKFDVSFEIPVKHEPVNESCVIVKHYTHYVDKDGTQVPGFLIEAHFQHASDATRKSIQSFLASMKRAP